MNYLESVIESDRQYMSLENAVESAAYELYCDDWYDVQTLPSQAKELIESGEYNDDFVMLAFLYRLIK